MCSFAEIDESQIAVLSSFTSGTYKTFQSSGGGNAVLQLPPAPIVDGKLLRIMVSGVIYIAATSLGNITANIALTNNGAADINVVSAIPYGVAFAGYYPFSVEFLALWSSAAAQLLVSSRGEIGNGNQSELALASPGQTSPTSGLPYVYAAAAQTDVKLNLQAEITDTGGINAGDSITITQFKASLA